MSENIGIITYFRADKNYGFIKSIDSEDDYYFHITNVVSGFEPKVGIKVTYTPTEGKYGKMACIDVKPYTKNPEEI